ncbi:MAG: GTPase HflX [Bdellovibrionaceae bacterium]|nr:GTPase HflX [Pseudobdellovibrionaceae bacterium]
MLEPNASLLPLKVDQSAIRAVILGEEAESLQEMVRLLDTLSIELQGEYLATIRRPHPGTYFGQGKLEEIQGLFEASDADLLVVDVDLTPNQLKNVEKIFKRPVIDRSGIILEIFSKHAQTRESKVQVELARLQYLLPRLTHFWSHFERQRGGGVGNRGMGEKQLEVDRRLLGRRMNALKDKLEKIKTQRAVQRASREDVLKVALIGYTNAGKSTLLNALTHSQILAEDKLFATLDSSVRAIDPDCRPPVVAMDTVGFINKIPTTLVASFRSTLEVCHEADLLLHVVDSSSHQIKEEIRVTQELLGELDLQDKPIFIILNKKDQLKDRGQINQAKLLAPGSLMISALDQSDVEKLRTQVLNHFKKGLHLIEILIPYSESRVDSMVHQYGMIEVQRFMEKGTFYRVRIQKRWAEKLRLEEFQLGEVM